MHSQRAARSFVRGLEIRLNNAVTSDFTTGELIANLHKIEAKRMVSGIMICSSKIAVI
jgi:hypothetical protein